MSEEKKNSQQQKKVIKTKRIDPALPGGFRDYGPAEAIARGNMVETIRKTFESFGFDPLETSAIQRTDVLTGGEGDSGKIIFNVKGSQEEDSDAFSPVSAKEGTSLRFDLTVPLARFVAANPDIPKPFKRYQIGTVWRGERQQAGRYREFMQADVDIVGSSSVNADAEIAVIIYTIFKKLDVGRFVISYNNRKILDMLPEFAGFPGDKLWDALRIIDKKDKIGEDGILQELKKIFTKTVADKIVEFLSTIYQRSLQGKGFDDYGKIANALCQNTGLADVSEFFKLEPYLVRGLSYYTGSVFEVTLSDAPEIGSVCGGGRYDELVSEFTGQNIPSVGVSVGVDRLFAAMERLGTLKKMQTLTQALVLNLSSESSEDYIKMVKELRDAGINTALYLGDDTSFQGQFFYAVRKEIPFVVIYGEEEKKKGAVAIKNLGTREQKEIKREELAQKIKEYLDSR